MVPTRPCWLRAPSRAAEPLAVGGFAVPSLSRAVPVLILVLANAWFTGWTVAEMLLFDSAADWAVIVRAAGLAGDASLYAPNGPATFPWSPIAATFASFVVPLGLFAWRLLHVAAVFLLPGWRLRLVVLSSWPFWLDFSLGNVMTFVFVAALHALKGSRAGMVGFSLLAVLIPRPLLIPVALWLLWYRPQFRVYLGSVFAVHGALVLFSGLGDEWIRTVRDVSPVMSSWLFNIGPSRWIGTWWMLMGIPLAAWLTYRGRLGLAGLAISPYVWPTYLLFGLLSRVQVPERVASVAVLEGRRG